MDIKARRLMRNRIERTVVAGSAMLIVYAWTVSGMSAVSAVLTTALGLAAAGSTSVYNLNARKKEGFKRLVMVDQDGRVAGVTDEVMAHADIFGRRSGSGPPYALYPIEPRQGWVKWSSDYSSGWNNDQGKYAEFEVTLVYATGGDPEKAAAYCVWARQHSIRRELGRVCRNELSEVLRQMMGQRIRIDIAAKALQAAALASLNKSFQGAGVSITGLHCVVELTECAREEWGQDLAKVDRIA